MTTTFISVKSLGHRYGRNWALAHLNFSAMEGESVAVVGHNGCGKSTLLKILATRLAPTLGNITSNGLVRHQIEWLGHELGFYKALSAEENLKFSYHLKGMVSDANAITEALREVGLSDWEKKPVHSFSAGMRKRLALSRIFLSQPKLILLDEPHANLDREGKAFMNRSLALWKKKKTTIFMASHDHEEVLPLCDKVLVLQRGQIAYFGETGSLPRGLL